MPPLIPVGFSLTPDPDTSVDPAGTTVWGGAPWRLLRLSAAGADLARALLDGHPVTDVAGGALARRLVESGLAVPVPPVGVEAAEIEVVVPARDRPGALGRCLTTLAGLRVTVVDDGSVDPVAVAGVADAHGARLVRLDSNRGPAAARNAGMSDADAEAVAFVDSDCAIDASTLRALSRHLADPMVAAVAPRVVPATGTAFSRLDMGERSGSVRPGGRVPYVPTTALVVRRVAVNAVGGFEEALRFGEDVDLVWRLLDAGWSVRYDARCRARHEDLVRWRDRLARSYRYGTSAGPLARRHGDRLAGPALAGLVAPARVAAMRRAGLPAAVTAQLCVVAPIRTARGLVRWGAPLWSPPLTLATALVTHATGRRPLRRTVEGAADEMAYGLGVWRGCLAARTAIPLLPRTGRLTGDGGARAHDDARLQVRAQPAQHVDQLRLSDGDAARGGAVV